MSSAEIEAICIPLSQSQFHLTVWDSVGLERGARVLTVADKPEVEVGKEVVELEA